jgi:hypothetical protein
MIDVVSNYKNYKKLGNVDDCGPTCDCYYCALLNIRTDKDTDEENEDYSDISDDEEADEQNLSVKHVKWGYDTIKMSSSSENISGKPKQILSKSKRQNHENSTQKDLRSRKKRKAKEECTSGQCQFKPIIQEVPRFVRDFENAMKQAREDSLYEDIADTLVGFWVKLLNFIWLICTETYRIVRGRTKIYPTSISSIHSTEERETMSQKTKPPADWPSRVLHL